MTDELLDVINEDDKVISHEMRSTVHRRGLLHRGVHVFLFSPEDELLVQRRSQHTEIFQGALDCSVSEHVKTGETYQQAAQRGLEEELSIRGVSLQPLVKFKMVYGENDIEVSTLFKGRVEPSAVRFNPEEVEGIAFYRLEELERLIREGEILFSGWFVQLINWYKGNTSELTVLSTY